MTSNAKETPEEVIHNRLIANTTYVVSTSLRSFLESLDVKYSKDHVGYSIVLCFMAMFVAYDNFIQAFKIRKWQITNTIFDSIFILRNYLYVNLLTRFNGGRTQQIE